MLINECRAAYDKYLQEQGQTEDPFDWFTWQYAWDSSYSVRESQQPVDSTDDEMTENELFFWKAGYEACATSTKRESQKPDDISHLLHIPSPFTGSFEPFALAMEECAKQSAANDGKGFTSLNTIVMAALLQYRKEVLEKLTNAPVRESVAHKPNARALQRTVEAWHEIKSHHVEGIIKGYLIAALMEEAQKTVKPIVESEREAERIGDLGSFRMSNSIEVEKP